MLPEPTDVNGISVPQVVGLRDVQAIPLFWSVGMNWQLDLPFLWLGEVEEGPACYGSRCQRNGYRQLELRHASRKRRGIEEKPTTSVIKIPEKSGWTIPVLPESSDATEPITALCKWLN